VSITHAMATYASLRGPEPAPSRAPVAGLVPSTQQSRSGRLIGDVVVDLGFADREAVEAAVTTARTQGQLIGQVLLERGVLSEQQLARVLAERFGVDYVDLSLFDVDAGATALIGIEAARRYQAVPIGWAENGMLIVAMSDPSNVLAVDDLSMLTGHKVRPAAASGEDIRRLIANQNRLDTSIEDLDYKEAPQETVLNDTEDDAPIVKLVHSIIHKAIEQGASDIHCDPTPGDMRVLFRMDGLLSPAATVARRMAPGLVSRIKIMASLDIAERRVPQDGRLAVGIEGRRVDLRVATLPLIDGEGVVMRVLDKGPVIRDLADLGMSPHALERFGAAIRKTQGAVLVSGPTGSGKSTTLYGALEAINTGDRSIITIEDPVESPLLGAKQMQVATKAGVTFATGLRSMLRADPDVIMVGEIRDSETAEIAVQAALTGHLVMSTLHTRDAPSALTRLVDMGLEPFMVAPAIDCIVAQRLARLLCSHCKRPAGLPAEVLAQHGLEGTQPYEPVGCVRCGATGYRGRLGLYEVMPMSPELRSLVLQRAGVDQISEVAMREGMHTMYQDGLLKVRAGLTSLAEIARVVSER
jgi:type IV pilus assembly protein PilB